MIASARHLRLLRPTRAAASSRRIGAGSTWLSFNRLTTLSTARTRKLPSLVKMSLADSENFKRLASSEDVIALKDLFAKHNFELRLAGGAVRDLLAGYDAPHDLDFATTATPEQMRRFLIDEGVRLINESGEKHGTITARINDRENYEVTTLRIDRGTEDGRRPKEVEFTEDWKTDAGRRDLTINSMFLDLDGTVYDYYGGTDDIKNRRVRFVGDPGERIQEDFLRILRYFRFFGRVSETPDSHESETIAAITANASGLAKISGERIWGEWKKILEGRFGGEITLEMIRVGLSPYIGLPDNPDVEEFAKISKTRSLKPTASIAALLRSQEEMLMLHARLKLSAAERDLGLFVLEHRQSVRECLSKKSDLKKIMRPFHFLIVDAKNPKQCQSFAVETLKYCGEESAANIMATWQPPTVFPVTGHDLTGACPKGRVMGTVIRSLRLAWKESDFVRTKEELLQEDLPRVLEEVLKGEDDTKRQRKRKGS